MKTKTQIQAGAGGVVISVGSPAHKLAGVFIHGGSRAGQHFISVG